MFIKRTEALQALIDEVVFLFHRMRRFAENTYGDGEQSAARRGILRELAHAGPRTVPQMVEHRGVSRQHIQVVVNSLLEDGLVEAIKNPIHKRSSRIQLTSKGEAKVREIEHIDNQTLRSFSARFSKEELEQTTHTLNQLRTLFETNDS